VKAAWGASALVLPVLAGPHVKPPPPHAPVHVPVHVAPPLPMLPSVARVRVETARDRAVVVEEIALPRGDWHAGGLDLYVAFGAPGTPLAVDAHLVAVAPDQTESRIDDVGDPVTVEPEIRHTPSSQLLLGRPSMAGVVVRVKDADLRKAYAASDLAALRFRSLLVPPAADAHGERDVVVRLGTSGGLPLTLDRVSVASLETAPWVTRAEASLCGPEADPQPLSVAIVPKPVDPPPPGPPTIAPVNALRHASDDLCVRWWTAP
jgi:hypothetical protein